MKVIAVLGLVLVLASCSGPQYSDGARKGVVQKLSYRGLVCKSVEGELALYAAKLTTHSIAQGRTAYSNSWAFSVEDETIRKQLEEALASGTPVTLHYRQRLWPGICSTETAYIVTKVTP